MFLVLDNRDSFTFNLVQALSALGARVEVVRSDAVTARDVAARKPDRILVGPGPGGPDGAGCSVEVIAELSDRVPILGVCLGHQALGAAFGACIGSAHELVHGRTVAVTHDGHGVFRGLPRPARFTRYNSLTVLAEHLPDCLEISARAPDGDVMGLRHRERPAEGIQFHPESVLSEHGLELLANFLRAES